VEAPPSYTAYATSRLIGARCCPEEEEEEEEE
jgi:hypothetical protein